MVKFGQLCQNKHSVKTLVTFLLRQFGIDTRERNYRFLKKTQNDFNQRRGQGVPFTSKTV